GRKPQQRIRIVRQKTFAAVLLAAFLALPLPPAAAQEPSPCPDPPPDAASPEVPLTVPVIEPDRRPSYLDTNPVAGVLIKGPLCLLTGTGGAALGLMSGTMKGMAIGIRKANKWSHHVNRGESFAGQTETQGMNFKD